MRKSLVIITAAMAMAIFLCSSVFASPTFVPVPDLDKYLTPDNMAKLEAGEVVKENVMEKDAVGGDSGRAVALIIINASKDHIMGELAKYETYPQWMPSTKKTTVISRSDTASSVEFELSILGQSVKYTVIHKIDKTKGTIQWRMDDSKPKKNVKDSVGAWVLKAHGNKTIVAYTVQVETGVSVPKFIQNWLSNSSLIKVLKAVKKQVEEK
jgi:ribosome-associated toxin RatA of RatAB toxin-antitoxin module